MRVLKNANVLWGLFLVLIGVGFLLSSFRLVNFNNVISDWWPLVLVVVALLKFSDSSYKSGIAWLIIGLVLLLLTLDVFEVDFWSALWPLVLILIGVNFILGSVWKSDPFGNDFNLFAVFGESKKVSNAESFSSANMVAAFGGTNLDLRNSKFDKGGATVSVLAVFGGAEIVVADNIPVKLDVFALFGGSEDKRRGDVTSSGPTLVVQGIALFGGVEIRN